jgi:hypothetical protein
MSDILEFVIKSKDEFSSTFKKLSSHLPSLKTLAVGTAAGVTGLGASLFATAKTTADAYDKFSKLNDRLNLSTEFFSKMSVASESAGTSFDSTVSAIQAFQVQVGEASKGAGTANETLTELGISIYKANGELKNAEDLLPEVADGLAGMSNATLRTESAQKLFGEGGLQMLQILKDGSEGLEEYSKQAERVGKVVGLQAARNAAKFTDALGQAKDVLQGLKNTIGEEVMPYITGLANRFSEFVIKNRAQIIEFGEKIISIFGLIAEKGAYGVGILIDSFRGLQMLWDVLKIGFAKLTELLFRGLDFLTEKLVAFMEKFNFKGIFDTAIERVKSFSNINKTVIDDMKTLAENSSKNLQEIVEKGYATKKVAEYAEAIKNSMASIREEGMADIEAELERQLIREGLFAEHQNRLLEKRKEGKEKEKEDDKDSEDEYKTHLKNLEAEFNKHALTELQQLDKWYKTEQEKFKGHNDAIAKLDIVYKAKRRELDESTLEDRRRALSDFYSTSLSMLKASSGKETGVYKTAAAIEALISAHKAAAGALAALSWIPGVGPALARAASYVMYAMGIERVRGIYAAHGGMDSVPKEQTMLIDKGERIVSPQQNRDLTDFLANQNAGNTQIDNLNIEILPNATNAEGLLSMREDEWLEIVEDKIIPALKTLDRRGITVQ